MTLIVIDRAGQLIATSYLNVIPNLTRSASPYAVIENVVVDEPFRGTGLGKAIMTATLNTAWAAGCHKAMLLSGSRHASTHAFYRACGFAGDEKTAYVAPRKRRNRACSGYRKTSIARRMTRQAGRTQRWDVRRRHRQRRLEHDPGHPWLGPQRYRPTAERDV